MDKSFKNFAMMTGATLIMAVGTYFFKFTNNFTESPVSLYWSRKPD